VLFRSAMKIPSIGLPQMLKDGYKHQQGVEEVAYRNIQAVKELTEKTRTSYGPNGRNKMVINHLEKLFVTSDAATIVKELEVVHPAAKLVVMASQQQEAEMGDGTNFVMCLAGELLQQAEFLLRMGLHPSEVIEGYRVASAKAVEIYESLVVDKVADAHLAEELKKVVRNSIAAKQYGNEDFFTDKVIEAALEIMPKKASNFSVDSVRVVKILGASMYDTAVVRGMVFGREPDTAVHKAYKTKVAIFTCPIDVALTETKGTVLIKNAKDMINFSKGEEKQLEDIIKELAESGAKVIVTGSAIGELALHFLNRYNLVCIKILSKFELRRLCRVTGATAMTRLGVPTAEEFGYCEVVETLEIGSDRCTVFRQTDESTKTATIVVRGSTTNSLDDIERAIDDGVNVIKAATRDPRLLAGAGAADIEVAKQLAEFGESTPGINQYAIKKFAQSLEVIPRTLTENAGLDSTDMISQLYAAHAQGNATAGVDIEKEDVQVMDAAKKGIYDLLPVKLFALNLATQVALTILSVDQIIMSKPAGGPKVKPQNDFDEDD